MFRPHKYCMEICILFMQIYFYIFLMIKSLGSYDCCMYDFVGEENKKC